MPQKGKKYFTLIINSFPVLLLFILVFTGFDLSIIYYDINISFNLIYILIFFLGLKKTRNNWFWFNFSIRYYQ